mmetsp:Transcript_43707/g.126210  ORF Transcript_43707/g.126210 Transcript_43707/m.126210 type:complete len:411 (+) Transcript_43707:3-1235(+)
MGSGASRTKRSSSGVLYREKTGEDGVFQKISKEFTVVGLRDLSSIRELAHPSSSWRARLLASRCVEVLSCRWSPDDELIAAAYFDGGVRLWDATKGTLVHTIHLDDGEDEENVARGIKYFSQDDMIEECTTCMQWRPGAMRDQRQLLTVDTEGKVAIYNVPRGLGEEKVPPVWHMKEDRELRSCDWLHGDDRHIAVGGFAKTISLYDVETSKLLTTLHKKLTATDRITGHSKRIHVVRCGLHDPNVILSAAWDHLALLWDVRSANVVRWFSAPDLVMNGGEPADLSTAGDMVVTASDMEAGDITLWDTGGRGIVDKVPCAYSRPTSVQFSKDPASADIAVGSRGMAICGFMRRSEDSSRGQEERSWSLRFTGWSPQSQDAPQDVWAVDWAYRSKKVCVGAVDGTVSILSE